MIVLKDARTYSKKELLILDLHGYICNTSVYWKSINTENIKMWQLIYLQDQLVYQLAVSFIV